MLLPAMIDGRAGLANGGDFLECAIITGICGALLVLAIANALCGSLDLRHAYLLSVARWALPNMFGALSFLLTAPHLRFADTDLEQVSGITTTGSFDPARACGAAVLAPLSGPVSARLTARPSQAKALG